MIEFAAIASVYPELLEQQRLRQEAQKWEQYYQQQFQKPSWQDQFQQQKQQQNAYSQRLLNGSQYQYPFPEPPVYGPPEPPAPTLLDKLVESLVTEELVYDAATDSLLSK
jgi:hypothetical protein